MKILAVFAHPDDEAYGPGATLARYATQGHTVALVTLTRGEAGSLGICKTLPAEEVARLRTRELECAARALHISYLKIYDFPDKGLKDYPTEKAVPVIQKEIDSLQPDILITFHDKGISGHPDHIAVTRWCREAVQQSTSKPRLFYYGVSTTQAKKIEPHRKVIPFQENEITHIIDAGTFFSYKLKAIQCHASQIELWEKFQTINGGFEYFARQEHFSQVYPPARIKHPLDDLLKNTNGKS